MPKYNYSLSAWIYIHPVPNNKNEAYTENTSLINFGNVPNIMYNAQNQTLVFEIHNAFYFCTIFLSMSVLQI